MKGLLAEYSQAAQKLSRNPLGIIALFIVLVYGIAALVLGMSSRSLQTTEKLPLIYFLVFFPCIVLFIFYRLVVKHHPKLYAPDDFQDKEGFFRALSPLEQKQKLEEEIKYVENEMNEDLSIASIPQTNVSSANIDISKSLKQSLIKQSFMLAEELGIREIEREFNVSIHRKVSIANDYGYDGVFVRQRNVVIVEVKYLDYDIIETLTEVELSKFSQFAKYVYPKPSLLLVLITEEGLSEEQLNIGTDRLRQIVKKSKLPVEFRHFNFNVLKEKYGFEE